MVRTSPLRLKELFFPQVSVKALVPKEPDRAPRELTLDSLDISFAFDLDADGKGASAGVKIASKESPPDPGEETGLYQVQVEAFANFEVIGPEHKDALALYLRKFAAAAALIGAAREQIAMTTARGPWGVVMFPMISMDKVVGLPPKKTEPPAVKPEQPAPAKMARAKRKTPGA
jgi:hypothetical protein